jgi:exodeoxyribonuclease V beta subunit
MNAANQAIARIEDWTALNLGPGGRSLIEASAGTGKTWTISVLYLRLLLEQNLSPRQIVVTTFTDAAAQELRERLRARLVWAEQAADGWMAEPNVTVDASPDLQWLQGRWAGSVQAAAHDRLRLKLAQAELDLAPVGTLHGLCRRILSDYPFESGSGFQLGDMVSSDSLLDEWAQDLWRQLQQGDAPLPAATPTSLGELRKLLKAYLQPGVTLWAPDDAAIERLLPTDLAERLEALAARKNLFAPRKRALKEALLALVAWLRERAMLKDTSLGHLLGDWSEQCLPDAWETLRHDPLCDLVRAAARLAEYQLQAPRVEAWQGWLAQVERWREQRLSARGQLSFDELISRVRLALTRSDRGLAKRLFAEWPVALVDEFQDTDAQQYAILDAIYRDKARATRGRLVMIGDPKQAIYRFRGGDIEAYLHAAQSADEVLRLVVNHRSARGLVAALNQFYATVGTRLSSRAEAPIHYETVQASGRRDSEAYLIDGAPLEQPLQLHLQRDYAVAVPGRVRHALEACANQIATMLQAGTHRIGTQPLQPGDIAVLLPGNADIAHLRTLLQQRGVPCVGAGKSTVFAVDAARELQVLLYGIEHAGDEGALRAALATRLYGMSYAQLKALREQPDAWLVYEQQFQQWRARWQREGVLAVVRALIERAAPTLLAGGDGERMLTDLRHLGELLQEATETLHGAEQLLEWLAQQREGHGGAAADAADEQQLRIESDARRVRLMTLHASKGLEFPIVFLPLMWDHTSNALDTIAAIHEPLCQQRVIGMGKAARTQYEWEGQDERHRVLYVALTRAIHACHVYVLPPERAAKAGSEKPLSDPQRAPLDAIIERLLAQRANAATDTRTPQLHWDERGWHWPHTHFQAHEPALLPRRALALPPAHPPAQVYSFSTLTRSVHVSALEDQAASDEAGLPPIEESAWPVAPLGEEHPELAALASIRGADIGNALHAIFEHRKLGQAIDQQDRLIEQSLAEFGVRLEEGMRAEVLQRLARRVQANLDAPLLPGLRLGALPAERQLAEMEFHYLLDAASMRALREVCIRFGEPELVPVLGVSSLRGRMTGKIDLILEHQGRYLVLDYKSNYLGSRVEDYLPAALKVAMDDHNYRFQALLYTVALDRMLRQRIADYDRAAQLGESIYLFVRAVGLAPQAGIWRHRFDDALIEAVDGVLAGRPLEVVA